MNYSELDMMDFALYYTRKVIREWEKDTPDPAKALSEWTLVNLNKN